ncbi:Tudor and KH domain-containing protein-like protein [Frankliniella fusca]|uniref:Tudor and KH domain-containing protein-like protein n=1 Tax=Frankliniella fusca TaxID=407009 RepID=A0AAE1GQG1_9NEOP|nr:Tudor and KH domain-containing protein-like protein [Frankliniella fusca]
MDSSRLFVILGLSFTASATAAIVYLLLRKDEENNHETGIRSSRKTVIQVKVPNGVMGTIIGRGGCNVRNIQDKSGARINCNDESSNEEFRVVTIQGTAESAQLAESMIHEIIMNQPLIITHEMWVPARACGRIIGRGGETIRSITRASCAKIMVDSAGNDEATERRVLLKGTAEQISLAQSLIEKEVEEEDDFRRRVELSIANRSPRREVRDSYNYLLAPDDDDDDFEEEQQPPPRRFEKFDAGQGGYFDVFVSALENPGQFWVQLVSQRGVELDQLVEDMTEYYSKPENQELHTLQEISVGQIVAAPFDHDNKWYRAEILKIEEDEYDSSESRITLYYGDYGDTCIVKRKNIFDLRTDFLTLYFQAIECMLAHVKPAGEEWSDEAISLFEDLAQVAMWSKKLAHVVTYRESAQKKSQRAGSPVPVIEIHDMEKGINIGEELVKQGLAVWEVPSQFEDAEEAKSNIASDRVTSPQRTQPSSSSSHDRVVFSPNTSSVKEPKPVAIPSATILRAGLDSSSSSLSQPSSSFSSSSAFINKEKMSKQGGVFRPKTLETSKSKSKTESISNAENVICLPERFSSDEDSDGFVLE